MNGPARQERLLLFLIALCDGAFLILYSILVWNQRLAQDDFLFLAQLKENGILGAVSEQYQSWNTRWAANLINFSVLELHRKTGYGLLLFGVTNLFLFTSIVRFAIHVLMKKVRDCSNEWSHLCSLDRWGLSLFFVGVLFLSSIDIGETWFWLCSTVAYLWGTMAFLLAAACTVHPKKRWYHYLLGSLAFLYLGGSCGPLALLVLFLMLVLGLCSFIWRKVPSLAWLAMGFGVCSIGFLILYLGEGARIRESFFQDIGVFHSFFLNLKMSGKVLLHRILPALPYMLLGSLPLVFLGIRGPTPKMPKKVLIQLLYLSVAYGILLFFFQWPITYKTQDIAADRTLFPMVLVTFFFLMAAFYKLGSLMGPYFWSKSILIHLPLLCFAVLYGYQGFHQWHLTRAYSKAFDERIHLLRGRKDRSTPLSLEPLPPSGMLHPATISKDTTYHSNEHLRKGLGSDFPVRTE